MKIQALLSAACVLLTAVPNALAEEQSHAVAKPIDAFEDVLVSAGLYDPEDEEDSYDMEDVAKKDDKSKKSKKKSNKKKSKKSNKKKSKKSRRRRRRSRNRRRRRSRRRSRSYRNGMCRRPRRSDRELCDELEEDFCDSKRDYDRNRRLCRHLGFRHSVTDEEWALMAETVEEYLPEEYEMLIDEVANNLESSSGDEDSEDESEDFSPSFDSEDEDSEDLYDSEDSEDEDSEDMGDFVAKKDNNKKSNKKSNKKKSKKSNKKKSKKSSKRRRSSCDDRSKRSCKDKRSCEWVDWKKGKSYCRREYTDESSDYDFDSASEDFYSEN